MTEQELAEIEARANAAVGGEWLISRDGMTAAFGQHRYAVLARRADRTLAFMIDGFTGSPEMGQTAEFIANARTDVPALIAEVRRLWHILDALPPWDRCPWCGADSPWVNGRGERGGGCGAECPNPTVAAV